MKISIPKKTLLYTHPVFIIGSYDKEGVPNIMAASWGGICCSEPPCVSVSLRAATYSYSNILENRAFTVNVPTAQQVNEADYTGIYSGKNENKFESLGLTPLKSDKVNAPYVKEFPLSMICKVVETHDLGLHLQFIGEVIENLVDEEYLGENGLPDIRKIQPFIYDSATRDYYGIGEKLIPAYSQKKKGKKG